MAALLLALVLAFAGLAAAGFEKKQLALIWETP